MQLKIYSNVYDDEMMVLGIDPVPKEMNNENQFFVGGYVISTEIGYLSLKGKGFSEELKDAVVYKEKDMAIKEAQEYEQSSVCVLIKHKDMDELEAYPFANPSRIVEFS